MEAAQSIRERQAEFLRNWQQASEDILDRRVKNTKTMKLSDAQRRNVLIAVGEEVDGFEVRIAFRDSLRFQDMGAGRGYHKGTRLSATAYDEALGKVRTRRQKKIINRAAFARLHWLEEVMGGIITEKKIIESETIEI